MERLFPDGGSCSTAGDMAEAYADILSYEGTLRAKIWYWRQLLAAMPAFLFNFTYWSGIMIKNYFKMAYRSLLKNRMSTVINLIGLSITVACAITMFLFMDLQLNLDRFHENAEDIYLVENVIQSGEKEQVWGDSPLPLGPALAADFPQVKTAVRVARSSGALRSGERIFNERLTFVDDQFFDVFSFRLKYGNQDALNDLSAIIISESLEEKYFPDENPLGKQVSITFNNEQVETFFVQGVLAHQSYASSMTFDVLLPFEKQRDLGRALTDWADITSATFVHIPNRADVASVEAQMDRYVEIQNAADTERQMAKLLLDPMLDVPTKTFAIRKSIMAKVHPAAAVISGILALLVLALACFNFMNISIASASRRLKEIGVRKVMGSSRRQLIGQFLGENLMLCFAALVFGVLLAEFYLIPGLNQLLIGEDRFFLNYSENGFLWLFLASLLFLTGLGAGGYPAFYIASFQPTDIFKGTQTVKGKKRFTRVMLTVQFVVSFILVALGVTFIQNADYQRQVDWGYDQAQTIVIPFQNSSDYAIFKNEIRNYSQVTGVAGSIHHVGRGNRQVVAKIDDVSYDVTQFEIGYNYIENLKLRLISGRTFDENLQSDRDESVIVNETFLTEVGWDAAETVIGKTLVSNGKTYNVIGVLEDFHYAPFIRKIQPVVLNVGNEAEFRYLLVNVAPGKAFQTAEAMQALWANLSPNIPYEGFFQDGVFDTYFQSMENSAKMFIFISVVALIISCMGLFGLVTLMIAKRRKEISIRKVLGAGIGDVIRLINKEFVTILLISVVIGGGLGFLMIRAMLGILSSSAMPLGPSPFLVTAGIVLTMAFITIISQVYRGASINPVDSLRNE